MQAEPYQGERAKAIPSRVNRYVAPACWPWQRGVVTENHKNEYIKAVVNGDLVELPWIEGERVHDLRNRALKATHNTGRPPEEWEVRTALGQRLERQEIIEAREVFITLAVGIGATRLIRTFVRALKRKADARWGSESADILLDVAAAAEEAIDEDS